MALLRGKLLSAHRSRQEALLGKQTMSHARHAFLPWFYPEFRIMYPGVTTAAASLRGKVAFVMKVLDAQNGQGKRLFVDIGR